MPRPASRPGPHPNSILRRTRCEACKKRPGSLYEKVEPRDYSVERRRLCAPCAKTGGWIKVAFGRSHTTVRLYN
jgi:transcriptional regulator NrdR family protein